MKGSNSIVKAAIEARTLDQAQSLQRAIAKAVGGEYQRPLGDKWKNIGMMSGSGSFDHSIIENVTNMQDAVLERLATTKYGSLASAPFSTPREAAEDLLSKTDATVTGEAVTVSFHESDPPTNQTKRITAVFRDQGCSLSPGAVPKTIFELGSSHKDEVPWLQGAFGMGVKYTFRNAQAVVLVTRRPTELLSSGKEDRIGVAVVLWEPHQKTYSAYYLVDRPWEEGHYAEIHSVPASEFPDFDPGTHLALISYGVEGYHRRRGGDERSFDTVLNTRLFEPITPVRFTNNIARGRNELLRGLERRLIDNPDPDRRSGEEKVPVRLNGSTHHLPIRYWVFAKRGAAGERRSFVAYDHCVCFTSNGQVHKHWSPQDFRIRTRLNKLTERIFVVVDTDELPIELRTSLFTADRSGTVRTEQALRLEETVAAFLTDELHEINAELIRESISGDDERSTINIARQISRALKVKGFSLGEKGKAGGGSKGGGGRRRKIDLYKDPTTLEGPEEVIAEIGRTRFLSFMINAIDGFIPRRAQLQVTCDIPDMSPRDITVGNLRSGYVRVAVAVPDVAEPGFYKMEVVLRDWIRSDGGTGKTMAWTTKLELVRERKQQGPGAGRGTGGGGAGEGGLVALLWESLESRPEWDRQSVGEIEEIPAKTLADARPDDYGELASLEGDVPTVVLNKENTYLKGYVAGRQRELVRDADQKRDQYAVGVGVGLLQFEDFARKQEDKGKAIPPDIRKATGVAIARSVLSVMPAFDRLAREAGIEE